MTFEGMPSWTITKFVTEAILTKHDFENAGSLPGLVRHPYARQLKCKANKLWKIVLRLMDPSEKALYIKQRVVRNTERYPAHLREVQRIAQRLHQP
jgi:hypothetical protein